METLRNRLSDALETQIRRSNINEKTIGQDEFDDLLSALVIAAYYQVTGEQ